MYYNVLFNGISIYLLTFHENIIMPFDSLIQLHGIIEFISCCIIMESRNYQFSKTTPTAYACLPKMTQVPKT